MIKINASFEIAQNVQMEIVRTAGLSASFPQMLEVASGG
jgi:hypothetical protein